MKSFRLLFVVTMMTPALVWAQVNPEEMLERHDQELERLIPLLGTRDGNL